MTAQGRDNKSAGTGGGQHSAGKRPPKKGSVYKRQLEEKQKVKKFYGVSEEQFRRFFSMASRGKNGATGENLLCLLERRIDNVLYRLKLASTRRQARQMIVHGHVAINGKKVQSPSLLVKLGDNISFASRSLEKEGFVKTAIEKRLSIGIKVPEWLELKKNEKIGVISRLPLRADVHVQAEEHLIVEGYSK